jgi:hypothetical protein
MPTDFQTEWRVNVPGLLKEVLSNAGAEILSIPIQIFAGVLEEVAQRAIELDDPQLHALMCRLALYETADPYSKEYDEALVRSTIHKARRVKDG